MTRTITFAEEVYDDLNEIIQWYSEQRNGLQLEFFLSFEASLDRIKKNPLGYQLRMSKARYSVMHRFPYKIIYKLYAHEIKIYGVFHAKRNPVLIRKRLT